MTRLQFIGAVQRRLGFRTDLTTEILDEGELAQSELSRTEPYPWFLAHPFEDDITADDYDLPATFISWQFRGETVLYMDDRAFRLHMVEVQEALTEVARLELTAGRPQFMTTREVGDTNALTRITFYPTADMAYPVRFCVYLECAAPNSGTLTDSSITSWLRYGGELLAIATARRIAVSSRDPELVSWLEGEEQRLRAKLDQQTIAHEEAGLDRIIRDYVPVGFEEDGE